MDSRTFCNEIIKEINSLRRSPNTYANKILKYKSYFKGKMLKIPGSNINIKTEEGPEAYEEAAQFLKNEIAVEEMIPSKGLTKIAEDYLEKAKNTDPYEIGEIDIDDIVDKYGTFLGNLNRAMEFGATTPEQVVINLIVNDGDKTRCQRESLLNKNLKKIGVATGSHQQFDKCTVIVSCSKYDNKDGSDDRIEYNKNRNRNNYI